MVKAYQTSDGNYTICLGTQSKTICVRADQVSAALALAKSIPAGTHNRYKIVEALINQWLKK
jgi:GH24 family phage-related lysozyme (muramidase)